MEKINKNILKQLNKYAFSKDIRKDPLRFTYYTALLDYKKYLSLDNLEGISPSEIKYNKQVLNIIMNTDLHVYHLLVTELKINKYLFSSSESNYYFIGGHNYRSYKLTINDIDTYLYNQISTLFPSEIFVNYNTVHLKEILNLLNTRLESRPGIEKIQVL